MKQKTKNIFNIISAILCVVLMAIAIGYAIYFTYIEDNIFKSFTSVGCYFAFMSGMYLYINAMKED